MWFVQQTCVKKMNMCAASETLRMHVSIHSCCSCVQVHEAMCAAERARAEESIQRDEQFQEAMATPSVRAVVDAVVADPSIGPHVTVCASHSAKRTFHALPKDKDLPAACRIHSRMQIAIAASVCGEKPCGPYIVDTSSVSAAVRIA
jgi:hypothetical protein